MSCPYNQIECPCTKDCPRHGHCCQCVAHHKAAGTKLPACLRGMQQGDGESDSPVKEEKN